MAAGGSTPAQLQSSTRNQDGTPIPELLPRGQCPNPGAAPLTGSMNSVLPASFHSPQQPSPGSRCPRARGWGHHSPPPA